MLMVTSAGMLSAQDRQITRKERKAAAEEQLIEKTKALVNSGSWQFNATQMLPTSGRSRTLTPSYRVILNNGEIDSYLPYFGRAYKAEYGSNQSPMSFRTKVSDLKVEEWKKGGWIVSFKAGNKNDLMDFIFNIGETGSVTLNVNSTNRQAISYYGDLSEVDSRK